MTLVRTLLGIDLLVALVVVYFFVAGFADRSVSSFNMSLWRRSSRDRWRLGAEHQWAARSRHHPTINPGRALYALFVLLMVIARPRWN